MTTALHLVTPNNENRQVVPTRSRNADLRSREYLTVAEVEKLMKAARDGRYGHRDATLILIAFRHDSVHAHMLRHACGYALANAGHDTRRIQSWLGHRSIQHTVRYTELSTAPFKDFWRS